MVDKIKDVRDIFRGQLGELQHIRALEKLFDSCPYYLMFSPAIQEIKGLYKWREAGCLSRNDLSLPVANALEAFAAGVDTHTNEYLEQQRKRFSQ